MSWYENYSESSKDKPPEPTQRSPFATDWREAQGYSSASNSNLPSETKKLVNDGVLPTLDLHDDHHSHDLRSDQYMAADMAAEQSEGRRSGAGRDSSFGNDADLLVDKLLSDPTMVQALRSTAEQMSPQGLAALEQSLGQSLSLNPYTPDGVLAQQAVTRLTQEGAPASDLNALQTMSTNFSGSAASGSPPETSTTAGADPIIQQFSQSDPTLGNILSDLKSQMSPQGFAQLEQLVATNWASGQYADDASLMQQSLQQYQQQGASSSDLTNAATVAQNDLQRYGDSTVSTYQGSASSNSGGDNGGTAAQPATGGDNGGTAAQPATGGDNGGTATQPATGGDNGGTATQPAAGSDNGGTATQPAAGSDNGGTATQPAAGSDNGGTATPPAAGSDNGGTYVAPIVGNGNFVAQGGHIYDPNGNVFEPKGANIDPTQLPTDPAALASYVSNMKNNWDFNFVRLNLGDGSPVPNSSTLQNIVQAFTSQGMVVELEQHVHGADISQADPSLYQQWATQFKNNPYVWFGTPNELGTSNNPGSSWLSAEESVDSAIRNTGNQNIILQGDSNWGQGNTSDDANNSQLIQDAAQLQSYGNIVATEHVYNNDANAYGELKTALGQLSAAGYQAEMIDEYGETNWINGTPVSTENGAQAVIQAGEQLGVGSAVWRWTPDSNALTNNSDGNIADITPYGQMVLGYNQSTEQ